MHPRKIIPTFLLTLLLAAATVGAQSGTDLRSAADVARTLRTHPQLTIFDDVNAHVVDGTITLHGKVTTDSKKRDIERLIGRVEGVRQVRNQIVVLPASPFDDGLRYRVARAIYSNPAFWTYANMPRPPIRVIVEQGRVTLTGVVGTDVERSLARSLATGLGELSVTNDLRTESAARQ